MAQYLKRTVQIRGRPVGVVEDDRYTSVIAMERGYFPISHTGYRSLTGMSPDAVSPEMLEALAVQQDRERRGIVRDASSRLEISPSPLINYVYASHAAENALDYGFFAEPAVKQVLWPAAHRLFSLILRDQRFQAKPDGTWEQVHCDNALKKTRESLKLLEGFKRGEFPWDESVRSFSARAYGRLGPNGPEPVIEFGGETSEFGFEIEHRPTSPAMRRIRDAVAGAGDNQLNLFGSQPALRM